MMLVVALNFRTAVFLLRLKAMNVFLVAERLAAVESGMFILRDVRRKREKANAFAARKQKSRQHAV